MSALGDNTQISYVNFSSVCMSVCLCVVCSVFVTMVTHSCISAKNKDNATKLSGYDLLGLPSTSRTSCFTLVCIPDFSNAYISSKNKDNATKLSRLNP